MARMTVATLAQKLDDHLEFIDKQVCSIKEDVTEINKHIREQNSKVFKNAEFRERHLKWHDDSKVDRNNDTKKAIAITGIVVTFIFSIINIVLHFY